MPGACRGRRASLPLLPAARAHEPCCQRIERVRTALPLRLTPTHQHPHLHNPWSRIQLTRQGASPPSQVLSILSYAYGLIDIPDSQVVDQLLGVPTWRLHDAVYGPFLPLATQLTQMADTPQARALLAAVPTLPAPSSTPLRSAAPLCCQQAPAQHCSG
jgi:hypothetical protein